MDQIGSGPGLVDVIELIVPGFDFQREFVPAEDFQEEPEPAITGWSRKWNVPRPGIL